MAGVGIATGSALRRRQRRLRQWHRHERMTVAMALAEVTHHAVPRGPKTARAEEEVEYETHAGLRAQKTPPPGERPGILAEPGPQRSDRTVRRSSGETPLLVVASLAAVAADGVDAATLSFLTAQALEDRRKEEEERKMKEKEAQEVKLKELEARWRAVDSGARHPSPGPVRASLGPGRRQGSEAPEAARTPQPGALCYHPRALQEEKEEEEEEEAPEVLFFSALVTMLLALRSFLLSFTGL